MSVDKIVKKNIEQNSFLYLLDIFCGVMSFSFIHLFFTFFASVDDGVNCLVILFLFFFLSIFCNFSSYS